MVRLVPQKLRQWVKQSGLIDWPSALILLYHRVSDVSFDPQLLCVSPQHFAEHLAILQQHYTPMRLSELTQRMSRRQWFPRPFVAITFDDGYADNLQEAKPLLARYGIPATVFVTAGAIDDHREFWWDELERLLLQPGTLPEVLELKIADQIHCWHLDTATTYRDSDAQQHSHWNVLIDSNPTPRHQAYRELSSLLRPLADANRQAILSQLRAQANVNADGRTTHRALSAAAVRELAADGLVEVGAHSITHPVLSQRSIAEQSLEINTSKARLESLLSQPVTSFAYPFGTLGDYTSDTIEVVRQAGFARACSNYEGVMRRSPDPFQLPRFLVRNWDGDEFARRLREWMHG